MCCIDQLDDFVKIDSMKAIAWIKIEVFLYRLSVEKKFGIVKLFVRW